MVRIGLKADLPRPAHDLGAEGPGLYTGFEQPAHGPGVALVVAGHHSDAGLVGGGGEDLAVLGGELGPGALADEEGEVGAGLPPAGLVVEGGGLVEAELLVVVGADPLGGVDGAGLQGGVDIAPGDVLDADPQLGHDPTAHAGDAHLEPLERGEIGDLALEPAAHLDAGVSGGQAAHAEVGVQSVHQVQAATFQQPGVLLAGGQAEGDAGVKGQGGVLAQVVVARALSDLDGALLDGVEHLEGWDQLAGGVDADGEQAAAHGLDPGGEHLGGAEDGVQRAGEAAGEAPADAGAAAGGADGAFARGARLGAVAGGEGGGGGAHQRGAEEGAAVRAQETSSCGRRRPSRRASRGPAAARRTSRWRGRCCT